MTASTISLIDPQLLPLAQSFPAGIYSTGNLPEIRQQLETLAAMIPSASETDILVREHWAPGSQGAPMVRVILYTPTSPNPARPALLHVHGGGYIFGRPELVETRLKSLARELDCVVASVDYRLAPESPHPGPVEDAYAALRWLHAQAPALGVDRSRIAVGGESAGGGIAAALALVARDRAEVPVCFQWLIYPMLDDRTCIDGNPNPYTGEFIWTRQANVFGWSALLGHAPGRVDVSCYAAPARAEVMDGLPPTFIAVGALDLFLEEDLIYASRLLRAGIGTELHVYPGAFHAFDLMAEANVTKQFERDSRQALFRALRTCSRSRSGDVAQGETAARVLPRD